MQHIQLNTIKLTIKNILQKLQSVQSNDQATKDFTVDSKPEVCQAPVAEHSIRPTLNPPMYNDSAKYFCSCKSDYYQNGMNHFQKQDYKEALYYFVRGAVDHYYDACIEQLGICFEHGYGVEKNLALAKDLYNNCYRYWSSLLKYDKEYALCLSRISARLEALKDIADCQELSRCIEGIGNLRVVKNANQAAYSIRYNQNEMVKLLNPKLSIVLAWWYIEENISDLKRRWTCDDRSNHFYDGYTINADHYRLQVKRGTTDHYVTKIDGRECLLLFPKDACLDYIYVQENILKRVRELLHQRALVVIPEVLQGVSKRINVPYGKCVVKKRIGHSALGWNRYKSHDIHIRSECVQMSKEKLETLCIHELTHNFVKGHGNNFVYKMIELGGSDAYELDQHLMEREEWPMIRWFERIK